MSINDKKGINLTSGFKYVGGQPLDVRLIAEDESDLQSLVDNGATYNGMVVWVNSTSKRMVFNGSEFIEDVNPNTIGNINDVLEQINGGGTSSGGSSSGGTSDNSILEWDLPMQIFIGMSLGNLTTATDTLPDEMVEIFNNNTYDIIKSSNNLGEGNIPTINLYLDLKTINNNRVVLEYNSSSFANDIETFSILIDVTNKTITSNIIKISSSGGSNSGSSSKTYNITIDSLVNNHNADGTLGSINSTAFTCNANGLFDEPFKYAVLNLGNAMVGDCMSQNIGVGSNDYCIFTIYQTKYGGALIQQLIYYVDIHRLADNSYHICLSSYEMPAETLQMMLYGFSQYGGVTITIYK